MLFNWGGWQRSRVPIYFVAWFVLPLALWLDPRQLWAERRLQPLCLLLLAALVLSQLPSHLGYFKAPIRILPYLGLFLTLLLVAGLDGRLWRWGLGTGGRGLVVAWGGVLLYALMYHPAGATEVLGFGLACLLASVMLRHLTWQGRRGFALWLMALFGLVLFAATHYLVPRALLHDWRLPESRAAESGPESGGWSWTFGPRRSLGNGALAPLVGASGLIAGQRTLNGYTPVGHRAFHRRFCFRVMGASCTRAAASLFGREPESGRTWAELLAVDTIMAARPDYARALEAVLPADWRPAGESRRWRRYRRPPLVIKGTLSWHQAGAVEVIDGGETREVLRVSSGPGPTRLVFARLYYPGYRATWRGQPLAVEALGGMLVSLRLPARQKGVLELSYRPPYWSASLALVMAGAVLLLALLWWQRAVLRRTPTRRRSA